MATANIVLLVLAAGLVGLHLAGGPLSGAIRGMGRKRRPPDPRARATAPGAPQQPAGSPATTATVTPPPSAAVNRGTTRTDRSSPELVA